MLYVFRLWRQCANPSSLKSIPSACLTAGCLIKMIQENGCIMFKLVIVSASHSRHTMHVILFLIDFQSHAWGHSGQSGHLNDIGNLVNHLKWYHELWRSVAFYHPSGRVTRDDTRHTPRIEQVACLGDSEMIVDGDIFILLLRTRLVHQFGLNGLLCTLSLHIHIVFVYRVHQSIRAFTQCLRSSSSSKSCTKLLRVSS